MDNENIQDVLETRQEVSEHGEKGSKLFHIIEIITKQPL